jgi:hypothetical protein
MKSKSFLHLWDHDQHGCDAGVKYQWRRKRFQLTWMRRVAEQAELGKMKRRKTEEKRK